MVRKSCVPEWVGTAVFQSGSCGLRTLFIPRPISRDCDLVHKAKEFSKPRQNWRRSETPFPGFSANGGGSKKIGLNSKPQVLFPAYLGSDPGTGANLRRRLLRTLIAVAALPPGARLRVT